MNTINDTQRTLGSPLSESQLLFQAHYLYPSSTHKPHDWLSYTSPLAEKEQLASAEPAMNLQQWGVTSSVVPLLEGSVQAQETHLLPGTEGVEQQIVIPGLHADVIPPLLIHLAPQVLCRMQSNWSGGKSHCCQGYHPATFQIQKQAWVYSICMLGDLLASTERSWSKQHWALLLCNGAGCPEAMGCPPWWSSEAAWMWPLVSSSGDPLRQGLEQMDPEGPAKLRNSVIFLWIALERYKLALCWEYDKLGIVPAETGELECENTGQCRNPPGVFWGWDLSCLRWVHSFLLLTQIFKKKFLIYTYKQP